MNPYLISAIVGGFLALENRSSLRLMISQPLCGGLLTGFLLGSPSEGLAAGTLMQLIFLGNVTIRGGKSPDVPMGGVAASALYVIAIRDAGIAIESKLILLPWAIFVGIAVAAFGQFAYDRWGQYSGILTAKAFSYIRDGRMRLASVIHLSILLIHFIYGFVIIIAVVPAARAAVAFAVMRFPETGVNFLDAFHLVLPFIGAGSLLRLNGRGTKAFLFASGFLVTMLVMIVKG